MPPAIQLISHSPEETREIGRIIGHNAEPGDVFLLSGVLGAGKTCITQGIAWGLGVQGYARSPTFVIATRYKGKLTLHHIDLFRIESIQEALDLGLEEYMSGEDVCVVEWADRASEIFPTQSLWIALEYGTADNDRLINIETKDSRHSGLMKALRQCAEAQKTGLPTSESSAS